MMKEIIEFFKDSFFRAQRRMMKRREAWLWVGLCAMGVPFFLAGFHTGGSLMTKMAATRIASDPTVTAIIHPKEVPDISAPTTPTEVESGSTSAPTTFHSPSHQAFPSLSPRTGSPTQSPQRETSVPKATPGETRPVAFEEAPVSNPTNPPVEAVSPTLPPVEAVSPTLSPVEAVSPTSPPVEQPVQPPPVAAPTALPLPETVDGSLNPLQTRALDRSNLRSGPLIGHTTDSSTKFWALQGERKTMVVKYWKAIGPDSSRKNVSMPPNSPEGGTKVDISGLDASTWYRYEIVLEDDDDETLATGQFQTAPPANQPAKFRYLLASCIDVKAQSGYPDQPVWDVVLKEGHPNFALMPGDTVYLNGSDKNSTTGEYQTDRIWYRNLNQRDERHFANFIRQTPTYTTWDDHDYGDNDSDRRQSGKEGSLEAFEGLWVNPYTGNPPDLPGNFYSFTWADVQFIVLDTRYYRNRDNDSQFGPDQIKWLEQQLLDSKSTFKVVTSAADFMERGFGTEIYDLGRFVTEHKISGVLFNAGDIHRNDFRLVDTGNWPYNIHQITSSGIARVWRRPFGLITVDTTLNDPEIKVNFYAAVDKELDTRWVNDPNIACAPIGASNDDLEAICTETIRLSDLTP